MCVESSGVEEATRLIFENWHLCNFIFRDFNGFFHGGAMAPWF